MASNTTVYSLASRAAALLIAPLHRARNHYYLFSSWDACCQGVNSTYNVRVGRSASVTGPYLDEAGVNLMNWGGTEVLSAYGIYIGPGGGSALHDGRRDFYSHHYYNANEGGNPYLHNREIVWDSQDWPHLTQPYMGHHNGLEAEHEQLPTLISPKPHRHPMGNISITLTPPTAGWPFISTRWPLKLTNCESYTRTAGESRHPFAHRE